MNKKKYKWILLIIRICGILFLILYLAMIFYGWFFVLKTPHLPPDASSEEIQRYFFLSQKKLTLMFSVVILNLVQLFKWFFRRSVLKQELFRTLVIMVVFIITYFIVND